MSSDYEPKKLVAPSCSTVSGTSKAWGGQASISFPCSALALGQCQAPASLTRPPSPWAMVPP